MITVMETASHRLKGVFLCLFGIILLSPDSLLLRLIGADLWTLAFWRGGLSAIGLAIVILLLEGRQNCQRQLLHINRHTVLVAVSFAIANIAFIFSIKNTAVANTLVIMSMSPAVRCDPEPFPLSRTHFQRNLVRCGDPFLRPYYRFLWQPAERRCDRRLGRPTDKYLCCHQLGVDAQAP